MNFCIYQLMNKAHTPNTGLARRGYLGTAPRFLE